MIVFFFLVLIISIWLTVKPNNLRKFYFRIPEKHDQTSIFSEGVLWSQSSASVYRSVYPSVCNAFSSQDLFSELNESIFLHGDIFAIYTKKWLSQILQNCIYCLGNLTNKTNLDHKWNIWHCNEGNITFCALNNTS